jgi:tetratricopeptide (TPR) repeat protein
MDVAEAKLIVQKFHDNNEKDLANQYLFLGQILVAMTFMTPATMESAHRILLYVFQKQLLYVGGTTHQDHPFLEQTVINLAIFYRSSEQLESSLQMWLQLRKIQESMYGEHHEALVFTYKNVGISYLGLGMSEKAEEFYLKALKIQEGQYEQGRGGSAEEVKEDTQQLASIYFNLYLAANSGNQKDKAKEYNLKNMEFNGVTYGENSLNVSNNCFIHAQMMLKTG